MPKMTTRDVVRLRCEFVGTNTEAHITLVTSEQTKSKIKSTGRMKLVKRIKVSLDADFFQAKRKLFHRNST